MMKFMEKKDKEIKEKDEFLKIVALAFKEWKEKEKMFEMVSDPELVDYVIYQMEASRLKYIYLLNKLRQEEEYKEKENSLNHG